MPTGLCHATLARVACHKPLPPNRYRYRGPRIADRPHACAGRSPDTSACARKKPFVQPIKTVKCGARPVLGVF
jgi:hypothetical protein